MKLLFVIPSLEYGGAARQLVLLALGLPRDRFHLRVCTLGGGAPWVETLRAAGVEVEALAWRRVFDPRPWQRLRELARAFQPDIVHAWGLPRPWLGGLLRRWAGAPRLILSGCLPARHGRARLAWLDRRLLRSGTVHVVSGGAAETERCLQMGLPADRLVQIPPAVALPSAPGGTAESVRRSLGLPRDVRLIAGIGPFAPHKGFLDAVWGLDILKYLHGDVHLALIGDGPERARLEDFGRSIAVRGQVHLLGQKAEVWPLLSQAEVAWVPSRREGGINAALEAMAAGLPVVAAQLPGLKEIIRDGETGLLFPPGSKALLARQTRLLLDDPERRVQMGEVARQHVARAFTVAELVQRHGDLYARA